MGVERDLEKAFEYNSVAASMGYAQSSAHLALAYYKGEGTPDARTNMKLFIHFASLAIQRGVYVDEFAEYLTLVHSEWKSAESIPLNLENRLNLNLLYDFGREAAGVLNAPVWCAEADQDETNMLQISRNISAKCRLKTQKAVWTLILSFRGNCHVRFPEEMILRIARELWCTRDQVLVWGLS